MDTDAYAHHIIARDIILSPGNLSLHWVWLPLFHYLSAGAIILGANFTTLRFANIILWSIIPFILFFYLYNRNKENNLFIALLASLICALSPIGILMGTTAQPEPLFVLLILCFSFLCDRKKYITASIILTLGCMLRYEAWSILLFVGIYFFWYVTKNKSLKIDKGYKIYSIIIIPSLFILAWALLRWESDGYLFGFINQTKVFANDALKEENSFGGGIFKFIKDLFFYPLWIPMLFMGINLIFVPFGILKTKKENRWLFISGFAILSFISLSWIMKSNLGLNRHFVSLIPLYAVLTANGVLVIAPFLQKHIFLHINKFKKLHFLTSTRLLLIILFITSLFYLSMWLYIWRYAFKDGYPERKEGAEYLKSTNSNATIYCNDAILEIFSNIDFKRFNHIWMDSAPNLFEIIKSEADKEGEVYIVTSEDKYSKFKDLGEVVFESNQNRKTNFRVIIMKVKKNEFFISPVY
jgi:hypothetical protein